MAWRFKASKYKNAAPIVPKPEACIRDICVGSYQTYGNNICSSAAFMAFNWEHVGSSLAVLPLDDCGRKSKAMPLLHAHSDTITDMQFSPFHDGLLLTGSQDSLVKVWHIPHDGLKESLSNAECTLSQKQRRVENVGFHPVADGLIHVASGHDLALWDLTTQKEAFANKDHTEVIQSTSWKKDGKLLATSCKDKKVRIIDPRAPNSVLDTANSHPNIKDSRIVWLGDQDRILTTGFDAARLRQIMIRDVRNLSQTQKTLELDCSTGILMPLFDPDTNMLFLAGKGDTTILYMELTDREPYLIEGLRHSGEQTKGACLVPKRALRVMEGEVNRVLQLTGSMVVPIMYQVPRKSYRDYHADLYPDTAGCVTYLSAPMWLDNHDYPVPNISLHPDANSCVQTHRGNFEEVIKEILAMPIPLKHEKKPLCVQGEEPVKQTPKPEPPSEVKEDIDRIDFVNVKDLVRGMERQKNKENVTTPTKPLDFSKETNGYTHKIIDNGHDTPPEKKSLEINDDAQENEMTKEKITENSESTDSYSTESLSRSNSLINGVPIQAPRPLPRSSISEAGAGEEQHSEVPKPKPRTTAVSISGYKPRLGPKPFSASTSSDEFSFDKVFSVPAAPGLPTKLEATSPVSTTEKVAPMNTSTPVNKEDSSVVSTTQAKANSPCSDIDHVVSKDEYINGKSDTSLEEEVNSSDSGYQPKTPSTAERRKLFETTDSSGATESNISGSGSSSGGTQSIAERRRAYELRSVSVAVESDTPPSPAPLRRRDSLKSRKSPDREEKRTSVPNVATKRTSTVFGKVSKFRHLKGTPAHKSTHIENIKDISRQISGECNGFYANGVRCAVPVGGFGGGRVAVLELPVGATRAARAPPQHPSATRPNALLHPAPLQDWAWDPFNDARLLVACDDGQIREWIIPEDGLKESTNEPNRSFAAHPDKIYIIRFHPTASDLLVTAAHDLTVKIWDLVEDPPTAEITLQGHTDQIFALDWSPCGEYVATACKDGLIRVYEPRSSSSPLRSGPGPAGSRGARLVWALDATHLVVTGFDKVSERQILLYRVDDLSAPVCTVGLDVSPAILQIHLDHDSGTLFLTGRGDSTIYCYEVTSEPPYLCALSHHRSATLHQGISFLHKNLVAVERVEFARALRLTNGNVEPLSFTVPRIKSELFQDDLFPPTLVTWEPWLTGREWLAGRAVPSRTLSLQPPGMEPLSSHTTTSPQNRDVLKDKDIKSSQKPKPDLIKSHIPFDAKDKQESIMKSMSARMEVNLKLEQDSMEGVDESEWDQ